MSAMGETYSTQKPVIVRVKRKKGGHSPLDAFWLLEINERPFKRPLPNLSKLTLSLSDKKEDVKPKKVLVRHLETVTDSEATVDVIHSLFEDDVNESGFRKGKFEERKVAFKKDNRKEQLLTKAVLQQQTTAQNARFKQIWRSRKGNKDERCNLYDVIRVDDAEERTELTSLEDQKLLASFLPLLRENIPRAAEDIEADNIHYGYTEEEEEYVYDFYAVKEEEMDISCEDSSSELQFPLVIVKEEEEELCDGPDESDYDSDDSNAETHPRNEYLEEEEEEEEMSEASYDSEDEESSERDVRMVLEEDEYDDNAEDSSDMEFVFT